MLKNMGTPDRSLRIVIALAVGVLYFTGQISGIAAIILGVLAVIFLVTSFFGFCPLYAPFKLSTRKGN
jgi:Na+(H+)/acetate symporter ActP